MKLIDLDSLTEALTKLYEEPSAQRRTDLMGNVYYQWTLEPLINFISNFKADISNNIPLKKATESVIIAGGEMYEVTHYFTDYDKGWNAAIDKMREMNNVHQ